ncbi:MAG: hypothetical protein M9908_04410 [Phyllobacteriaceae bacterium]|nr:hypothetical protein [Phyllobacteriaceae bacterium]
MQIFRATQWRANGHFLPHFAANPNTGEMLLPFGGRKAARQTPVHAARCLRRQSKNMKNNDFLNLP